MKKYELDKPIKTNSHGFYVYAIHTKTKYLGKNCEVLDGVTYFDTYEEANEARNKYLGIVSDKKLNNYQTIIAKNHKKIENQKNEITRLQNALNMANCTVAGLMDEVSNYKRIVKHKNEKFFSEIDNIEKRYESQLKVHENELDRRLTIIHYLEDRLFNKGE